MDLKDDEREFLTANRAVKIDEDGIERFVGLGPEESVEYLMLSRASDAGVLADADRSRYEYLRGKHEAERQVYARGEKSLQPFQNP
jgi:hypothetical protein